MASAQDVDLADAISMSEKHQDGGDALPQEAPSTKVAMMLPDVVSADVAVDADTADVTALVVTGASSGGDDDTKRDQLSGCFRMM